ncbi:hypothetical protein ABZ927_39085 [Streptomyces massasporeus]
MARKLNKKGRETAARVCAVVAALFAVTTYALVPLEGRGPIGVATLAAGALAYTATRWAILRGFAYATRPRPTK